MFYVCSTAEVAAVFAFGREDIIPKMFTKFVNDNNLSQFGIFDFYLRRHIELDEKDHGPLAIRLVEKQCGSDLEKWKLATTGSIQAT